MSAMSIYSLKFYVYAYLRASDNTPYYIGKGQGKRWQESHTVSVPKDRSKIVFLEKNLSNIGACALERRYIRWYGRKDLGTGILRNRTDGGEGNVGLKMPESAKEKIRQFRTGRKLPKEQVEKNRKMDRSYMKTEEYRKIMSLVKKGVPSPLIGRRGYTFNSKKVKGPDGKIYVSMKEAADLNNITYTKFVSDLKTNKNGFSFC